MQNRILHPFLLLQSLSRYWLEFCSSLAASKIHAVFMKWKWKWILAEEEGKKKLSVNIRLNRVGPKGAPSPAGSVLGQPIGSD